MVNEKSKGIGFFVLFLLLIILGVLSWFMITSFLPQVIPQKEIPTQPSSQQEAILEEEKTDQEEGKDFEEEQSIPEEVVPSSVERKERETESSLLILDPSYQAKGAYLAALQRVQSIPYVSLSNPARVKYNLAVSSLMHRTISQCSDRFFRNDREAMDALAFLGCIHLEDNAYGGRVTYDKSVVAFRQEDESKYAPTVDFDDRGYLNCPELSQAGEALQLIMKAEDVLAAAAVDASCVDEKVRVQGQNALALAREALEQQQYLKASWNYRNAWNYVIACQC